MSILLLALLFAFAIGTGLVLADSGLRLWSALGAIKAQRGAIPSGWVDASQPRMREAARMTTRVSYARTVPSQRARQRAAA